MTSYEESKAPRARDYRVLAGVALAALAGVLTGCSTEHQPTPNNVTSSTTAPAPVKPSLAEWACTGTQPNRTITSPAERAKIQAAASKLAEMLAKQDAEDPRTDTMSGVVNGKSIVSVYTSFGGTPEVPVKGQELMIDTDKSRDGGVGAANSVVISDANNAMWYMTMHVDDKDKSLEVGCAEGNPRNPADVLAQLKVAAGYPPQN